MSRRASSALRRAGHAGVVIYGPARNVKGLLNQARIGTALSQISILRVKFQILVPEIQWLTGLKFPEKANLRQSPYFRSTNGGQKRYASLPAMRHWFL